MKFEECELGVFKNTITPNLKFVANPAGSFDGTYTIYILALEEEIQENDFFYYESTKEILKCTRENMYFNPEQIKNYSNTYKVIGYVKQPKP